MRKLFGFFCNIMKCFLMSCGIVLLFYFFNEEVPVTKELIQRNVLVICYSLISLLCVYQITKRMFSDDDYNVITGTSLGYAKRVIRSENKMIRLLNIIGSIFRPRSWTCSNGIFNGNRKFSSDPI